MPDSPESPGRDLDRVVRLAQGLRLAERVGAGLSGRERDERKLLRPLCFAAFQAIEAARLEGSGPEAMALAERAIAALEPYDEGETPATFEPFLREHPMSLLEGAVRADLVDAVMDRSSHRVNIDGFVDKVMERVPEDLVRNYLERAREMADSLGEGQREDYELVWKKLSKGPTR
jgi:hypothetical protein